MSDNPRVMQVMVVFEFVGVEPDSQQEEDIIETMSDSTESMRIKFDADDCWLDNAYFLKVEGDLQ